MPSKTPVSMASAVGRTLNEELSHLVATIRENPALFPRSASRVRIAISLANGERLDLEMDSSLPAAATPSAAIDPAHDHELHLLRAEAAFAGIADLGLGKSAKAAAQELLKQFPADVKFTSGRRSISEQASAMAPNVVKNRKWIEQTYKDTSQRAALQKWVDDHPEAKTASALSVGLESVMQGWTETEKRNFSRHISGDAFDVQPVAGDVGKKIKDAIGKLPKLNWHTFSEGGLEIWHAQFDA